MDAILSYIRNHHGANKDVLFTYHKLQRIDISWIGTCNHLVCILLVLLVPHLLAGINANVPDQPDVCTT